MKPLLTIVALALLACAGTARAKDHHYHAPRVRAYHAPKAYHVPGATVPVRGYVRSNGTYVAPSYRTSPNRTKVDNWSSKPNVNPYTGKPGTKDPYVSKCCGS